MKVGRMLGALEAINRRSSLSWAVAAWCSAVDELRARERQALAVVPPHPRRREVSLVTKHFLTAHHIRTRADLEIHKLAHESELLALRVGVL